MEDLDGTSMVITMEEYHRSLSLSFQWGVREVGTHITPLHTVTQS